MHRIKIFFNTLKSKLTKKYEQRRDMKTFSTVVFFRRLTPETSINVLRIEDLHDNSKALICKMVIAAKRNDYFKITIATANPETRI